MSAAVHGPWQALSPTVSRRAVLGRRGRAGYTVATEYRTTECGRTTMRLLAEQDYPTAEAAAAALAVRLRQVAA